MPSGKRLKALILGMVPVMVLMLSLTSWAFAEEEEPAVAEALAERLLEEEATLQDFYAAREGRPAWLEADAVAGFAAALRSLEADGLNSQDYWPDALVVGYRKVQSAESTPTDQANFDLQISRILLTALHHLQRGKVDPNSVDPN